MPVNPEAGKMKQEGNNEGKKKIANGGKNPFAAFNVVVDPGSEIEIKTNAQL